MTIDPNCWVELAGTPPTRAPRVTTDATSPTPTDGVPPVEGDVHVVTGPKGGSFVYDKDTASWLPLGTAQFEDNVYWGWGSDATVDQYTGPAGQRFLLMQQAQAAGNPNAANIGVPAHNEARVWNVGGKTEIQTYQNPTGAGPYDPAKWQTVTTIREGDEYIDMNPPQTIYQLSP